MMRKMLLTSTHLLRNHDSERSECCSSNTWYGEQLDEAGDIIAVVTSESGLGFKLGVDVIEIAGSLELGITQLFERLESVSIASLLDVPARRLCARQCCWTEKKCRFLPGQKYTPMSNGRAGNNADPN
jgi:hypothetical protein